ncbi:DUF3037 domain-containing protein [Pararhizobium sp.]|uniref:DUF3037 domain-containing protein n=1 Tax=Pararhizobium sp. TaxID=1977563 RepID=UPI002723B7F4|nr:DUF3037 domain-containing protein [Pararhizobium sp.]MDO9416937.1 DUF3037 domain-containing protein [Pararhizobium sp.]
MERIYEYAIIRIVPYAYRGEQINIGILVFTERKADVLLDAPLNLMKAFGVMPSAVEWVADYIRGVDEPARTSVERWNFLRKSAGFTLSEIGWFSVYEDSEYELRIQEILDDYVRRPKIPVAIKRKTSLMKELKNTFQFHDIMGKKSEDLVLHKVVSNVPVGPSGKLHIDFLLSNSFYHATETIDFRGSDDAGLAELKDAALAAVTLRYAREQLGSNSTKCYLVYAASPFVERAVQPALSLVESTVDQLFNMESKEDKSNYINCMIEASGGNSLFSH